MPDFKLIHLIISNSNHREISHFLNQYDKQDPSRCTEGIEHDPALLKISKVNLDNDDYDFV